MSGKTNIMATQEGREIYGDEAVAGATSISHNDNEFVEATADFEAARAEESAVRASSQRSGNRTDHAIGTVAEREEDAARNHSQPVINCVEQATGEIDTIFGGGKGRETIVNHSRPHTRWVFLVALG